MRHNHSDRVQTYRNDTSGWRPRDPPDDFRFPVADTDNFTPNDWPADPSAYRSTSHFRQRFRQHDRVFYGDILRDAITSGNLVPALRDTAAFYTDRDGVVYYVLVGWDHSVENPQANDERVVITCWPWVYDRETALDSGRYSTRLLNQMMGLNNTLLNEDTADDFWLEYYDRQL